MPSSPRVHYQKIPMISKQMKTIVPIHLDLHFVDLLEQIVINLLAHNRIELVCRMGPDEVPDPRGWGLELSGGTFADEIKVFEETATLAVVDV